MSALGQKRTLYAPVRESALGTKADILVRCDRSAFVRLALKILKAWCRGPLTLQRKELLLPLKRPGVALRGKRLGMRATARHCLALPAKKLECARDRALNPKQLPLEMS